MKLISLKSRLLPTLLLIILAISMSSGLFVLTGKTSPASTYYYRFTVDREGFTSVAINFNSTDSIGSSWIFVPKPQFSSWNYTVTRGQIVGQPEMVETDQVPPYQRQYFYQAFKFRYRIDGIFNMTITYGFNNGALIVEPRGIFYSSQIGFQSDSNGKAEILLHRSFRIDPAKAVATGALGNYPPTKVQTNRALFNLPESPVRIQMEFDIGFSTPQFTTLRSGDNKTFTFKTVSRYESYAQNVLKLYDRVYNNSTRLFNVTLDGVAVQWFLPDFGTLLSVGGFVPFTGEQLGEININIVFIRAINGTVEDIAVHELVHRFLGKTGVSPRDFLWFHEGMAQYISVSSVVSLGYEGAIQEKSNLENGAAQLIQDLDGENFGKINLQDWTPSYQPPSAPDVGILYAASYYVVSQLPKIVQRDGFEYYGSFFRLINGVKVNNLNVLTLYLSTAANASVALSLQRWGFTVTDLYSSPVSEMIKDAGKTVEGVNPIFQPYRSFAEYLYEQALLSSEKGDWERAKSLLQLAVTMANLAPLLTFVTIIALLALLVYILNRRSKRPKQVVPPLPPEILQPTA